MTSIPVNREPSGPVEISVTVHRLTAADRCDRCPAQARVETMLDGLQLLWCAHHFHAVEASLLGAGAVVSADERGDLR